MQIATEAPSSFRSSAVRPGALGLIREALAETFGRRRLIRHLISADIRRKGSDTLLGNVWWVLDPLLQMTVYLILLSVILRRSTPDFPLFLFAAILPWKWFASSINDAVSSVVRQERLIKQVQFPKVVLPVSAVAAEVLNLAFGFVIVLLMLAVFFPAHATINVLWLPVIAAVQFVFTLGLALLVSAINVFYRDVGILSGHLIRLWFFLSPAIWSFDSSAGRFGAIEEALGEAGVSLLRANPFAVLLTAYRDVIYGRVNEAGDGFTPGQSPDLIALGMLLLLSIGLLILGTIIFKRLEPAFAKVL
ncbi:MAG TPA: ABC transporter permease [Candidatus Limnocylindrales bacterium]|nr:ABC transporter permease [Candidatus Limnocylindrales bacterium]